MGKLTLSERFMYYAGLLVGAEASGKFPRFRQTSILDDLKHISDLLEAEEQERLFKIPFKLGKKLYDITEFVEDVYCPELIEIDFSKIEISRDGKGLLYIIDCSEYRKGDFGTILFDSEEEAWKAISEKALEEMEK